MNVMTEKQDIVIGINLDNEFNEFDNFIGKLINKYK